MKCSHKYEYYEEINMSLCVKCGKEIIGKAKGAVKAYIPDDEESYNRAFEAGIRRAEDQAVERYEEQY